MFVDPILIRMDQAYAITAYASQSRTADTVIAALDSREKMLTSQQTFYVEASRGRNEISLVVDSKEAVTDRLKEHTGEKTSALEAIRLPGESGFFQGQMQERDEQIAATGNRQIC